MSNVFERVALANQTKLAVSRPSSGASSGGNLAFVGDASQVSCVIRIYIRMGCVRRAFLEGAPRAFLEPQGATSSVFSFAPVSKTKDLTIRQPDRRAILYESYQIWLVDSTKSAEGVARESECRIQIRS